MTAPRRRWSFSLRTLFVLVTVFALPLGWTAFQFNWIRERHRALKELQIRPITFCGLCQPAPPFPLGLFGEVSSECLVLGREIDETTKLRLTLIFPESTILVVSSLDEERPATQADRPESNGAPTAGDLTDALSGKAECRHLSFYFAALLREKNNCNVRGQYDRIAG
jgi:hypothetical protein